MLTPVSSYLWRNRADHLGLPPRKLQERVDAIARELGTSPVMSRLLALRGCDTPAAADRFLNGTLAQMIDPLKMAGMGRAVDHLVKTIHRGETVCLSVDFDCDGVLAGAILVQFFSMVGGKTTLVVPDRIRDGYGLSAETLRKSAAMGIKTVITADCGITAVEEARLAKELKITLILTDHHQAPPVLPEAFALINPHLPHCPYPDKSLCGAGVALMLCIALRRGLRESGWFNPNRREPDINRLLDLACMATVADLVPLTGINRPLVRAGLARINAAPRPGIKALMETAGLEEVTVGKLAFQLCPRVNAPGRLSHAGQVVEMMLAETIDAALPIAQNLHTLNQERQDREKETIAIAEEKIAAGESGTFSIVLADSRFTVGVVGIAASKLVERYHRPTFLLYRCPESGLLKGSARSIPGFHLVRALENCRDLLLSFGGHEMAAGLKLEEKNLPFFCRAMEDLVKSTVPELLLTPSLLYDDVLRLSDLSLGLVEQLEQIGPTGIGCPNPAFVIQECAPMAPKILKDAHLSFQVHQGGGAVSCIAFNQAEKYDLFCHGSLNLLCQPQINEWRDRKSVQLVVKDIQPPSGQFGLF